MGIFQPSYIILYSGVRYVNILERALRQHLAVAEQTEARKERLTDDLPRF
jgi:hypothetical protein